MSLPPPKPIPTSSPSTGPYAVSIASLQTHVNQLASSNQEIEGRLQESEARVQALQAELDKVQSELTTQSDRAQKDLNRVSSQYRKERREWKSGSDALQVVHNVSHLRTSCLLNEERLARWDAEDAQRRQRVAILVRDHRISLFRTKERELENRLNQLESTLEEEQADHDEARAKVIAEHEEEVRTLRYQLETTVDELQSRVKSSKVEEKTRKQLEDFLAPTYSPPTIVVDEEEDVQSSPEEPPKPKPKPTAPKKRRAETDDTVSGDDRTKTTKAKPTGKGKSKMLTPIELSDDDTAEVSSRASKQPKAKTKSATSSKAPSVDRQKEKQKEKQKETQKEKQKKKQKVSEEPPDDGDEEEEEMPDEGPKPKKKRKINLNGGAQSTWAWSQMGNAEEPFGIPTEISPVKGAVPARSQFGGTKSKPPSGLFSR
ncbi:hypothetical protein FRC02_006244 [Tulasnella sp. 418]|nr:hypothetical protein FRC02_006244 [Tulasnella sp. 418]